MKYLLKHSLAEIAAIRVVVTLWNQHDVRTLMVKVILQILHVKKLKTKQNSEKTEEWQYIENTVIGKVQKLPLPNILKEKILGFIKPIGLQILRWLKYHCTDYLRVDPMTELFWTSHGTIDKKKTAEMLVKDDNLSISTRYKLACIYCLEDDIQKLRNKMPKHCIETLTGCPSSRWLLYKWYYTGGREEIIFSQQKMVFLWTYEMFHEISGLDNAFEKKPFVSYKTAFKHAIENRNVVAVEHFLKKLSPSEKEESLVENVGFITAGHRISSSIDIPEEGYADVLCFLYLQMEEEQAKEAFKKCHLHPLICFLEWPWLRFFVQTASHMQDTLLQDDYFCLLTEIIRKERDGHKILYQNLFGEFWQIIPDTCKRSLVEYRSIVILLSNLFEIKDIKNIKLIFRDLTLAEKQECVFIPSAIHVCKKFNFDNDDDLNLLKYIIQECEPSKTKMMKFKDDLKKHMLLGSSKTEFYEDNLDKIFHLLNEFACEYDK